MRTAIVVEDEFQIRKGLITLISDYCENINIVAEADCVESGILFIKKHNPDIVFLDIRLPDGTGFDLLEKLRKIKSKIIFVTSYSDYALKAIKYSAIDYILKPVIPEELIEAVEKAENFIEQENNYLELSSFYEQNTKELPNKIVLKTKKESFYVDINDIIYCSADENYTNFVLKNNKKILVAKTLKFYDEILSEHNFIRVHQSFLVNPKHIVSLQGDNLKMINNDLVEVSRRKKATILDLLKK